MKIAISGKGGSGKTTFSAVLCKYFANKEKKVIAIDADPDMNLARSLGIQNSENIVPIIEMRELIKERVGGDSGIFKLNPVVSDIPDRFFVKEGNIKLMVAGTIKEGGSGCVCPENSFLRALLSHLLLQKEEVVIIDMPAGIEHLGRGTASSVDALVIMVEPGRKSIETAKKIRELANELKIKNICFVGNKVKSKEDEKYIQENLQFLLLGYLPYSEEVLLQDKDSSYEIKDNDFKDKVDKIITSLIGLLN